MIQNSIFTSKRIDEQNGSLHQHKSTFVVIDYYQGFKPPFFLRLILREFKGKNRGRFGWTTLVRSSKWRQRHSPEADYMPLETARHPGRKCTGHERSRGWYLVSVQPTLSAFLLYGKTGKNSRVKGTGKFSSVKMERDERVPFTPSYVKKTLNPPNSNIN